MGLMVVIYGCPGWRLGHIWVINQHLVQDELGGKGRAIFWAIGQYCLALRAHWARSATGADQVWAEFGLGIGPDRN